MINFIKKLLGITAIERTLKNLDNDIVAIMEKQLSPMLISNEGMQPMKPDAPLPTEMFVCSKDFKNGKYGWYVIWSTGFAGPFEIESYALKYAEQNNLFKKKFCDIQKLYKHAIEEAR